MSDPIGTVRVHPADHLGDPGARRVILTARDVQLSWHLITGFDRPGGDWGSRSDNEIGIGPQPNGAPAWTPQRLDDLAVVLEHPQQRPTELAPIRRLLERLERHTDAQLAHYGEDLDEAREGLAAVLEHLEPQRSPNPGGTP